MTIHEPGKTRSTDLNRAGVIRVRRKKKVDPGLVLTLFLVVSAAVSAAFFVGRGLRTGALRLPALASHANSAPAQVAVATPDDLAPITDPSIADFRNPRAPLTVRRATEGDIGLVLIEGGVPGTRRSVLRTGVEDIVAQSGAKAGINGTFFANASLSGTDNLLIGPSICGDESSPTFSPYDRKPDLAGRPLVVMSAAHTRIYPYDPSAMDSEPGLRGLLPGMTDAFLGGVWLVHNGKAPTRVQMDAFHVHDAYDPRRRAFFFIDKNGQPGVGATAWVATSTQLAHALEQTGIQEAVLLDSGFSTSLVCGPQTLVTGHTSPGLPSRPVPHAVVLFADALPVLPPDIIPAALDRVASVPVRHHRWRRHA